MIRQLPSVRRHCRHHLRGFEVGGRAQSTSCPGCYKPVIVQDIIVDTLKLVTEIRATTIDDGAIIAPSFFDVSDDELGLSTLST